MQRLQVLSKRMALLTTVAALAACSGTTPPVGLSAGAAPAAPLRQSLDGARSIPLLFVAENTLSKIDVYDARKYDAGPVAEITDGVDGPVGLCIGAKGVLYVLNNGSDSISEYEPGQTEPFQTITEGLDIP
jgi:hypothetical protein